MLTYWLTDKIWTFDSFCQASLPKKKCKVYPEASASKPMSIEIRHWLSKGRKWCGCTPLRSEDPEFCCFRATILLNLRFSTDKFLSQKLLLFFYPSQMILKIANRNGSNIGRYSWHREASLLPPLYSQKSASYLYSSDRPFLILSFIINETFLTNQLPMRGQLFNS
jgi:hypothetical protein